MRRTFRAVALSLVAAGLAACGGGSHHSSSGFVDSPSADSRKPSEDEIAICAAWLRTNTRPARKFRHNSYGLKHVVLLDVMVIAALFVIRAAGGAAAVHVRISPWLLLCTALLALFLGLAKRYAELATTEPGSLSGQPVLEGYSVALVG